MKKIFKDFEGDELNISVTSVVFIDAAKSSLVFDAKSAKALAEWLLQAVNEKINNGSAVGLKTNA
jgi:hypothetical protein